METKSLPFESKAGFRYKGLFCALKKEFKEASATAKNITKQFYA